MPADHSDTAAAEQAQDRLVELMAAAEREHLAVSHALGNALQHAMAAGDALAAARELVPAGRWQAYLRDRSDISERSARVYLQVAKARALLERQSSAGPLSIAAALEYLKDPERSQKKSAAKPKASASSTSFGALAWWSNAPSEARQRFLDGVGLLALLAALPPAWRTELERRAAKAPRAQDEPFIKASEVLRRALSLIKITENKSISQCRKRGARRPASAQRHPRWCRDRRSHDRKAARERTSSCRVKLFGHPARKPLRPDHNGNGTDARNVDPGESRAVWRIPRCNIILRPRRSMRSPL
jgi:hypothetical protein